MCHANLSTGFYLKGLISSSVIGFYDIHKVMTREIGYECNIFIAIQVIEKGITYLLYFTQIQSCLVYWI